jgi:hypothetical protein
MRLSLPALFGLFLASPCLGDDRIKLVRETYEKVPATILGIKEPIQVTQCSEGRIPVANVVIVADANDMIHYFTWWRDKGKFQNAEEFDRFYWQHQKGPTGKLSGKFKLAVRGPEEDALYGLLLRWTAAKGKEKDPSPFDKLMLTEINKLLGPLDDRFSAEKPVLLK